MRYRCSIPQKQPAANVAFWAPSGTVIALIVASARNAGDVKDRESRLRRLNIQDDDVRSVVEKCYGMRQNMEKRKKRRVLDDDEMIEDI